MTDLNGLLPDLIALLDTATRENHVPGASVAVSAGDQVIELATGVLNLNTGVTATPDSLFQIGSITKTLTATLTMQLLDAGLVDLDEPVRTYVPELAVSDPEAAETVTVRQLLSHTSGLPGTCSPTSAGATTPCSAMSKGSRTTTRCTSRAACSPTATPDTPCSG